MYKFRKFKDFRIKFLEHPSFLEDPEDRKDGGEHQGKGDHPRPARRAEPTELYVHAEEAGDQSRRHQQKGHEGEDLHDLVLVEVDDTEDCVLEIFQSLEAEVGMVYQGRDVLQEYIQP